MIKILSIFFLISLTSCSYLIDSYEKDVLKTNNIVPKDLTENTTCQIIQKNILINESKGSQEDFESFIKNVSRDHILKFIDKVVLWSLMQINIRPDLNSPTAKLQVLLHLNGQEKYYNAYLEQGLGFPYFYLLEHLLTTYKSRYSLIELTAIYDQNMKSNFKVTSGFANFLESKKSSLTKHSIFEKTYLRGDETLKKSERIPKVTLTGFVKHYLKNKKKNNYELKEFLFSYKENSSFVPKCNFDMNLYDNSIFLINKKKVQGNVFGLKERENAFMAISSQLISEIKPLLNSSLLEGSSNSRSAALCMFKDRFKPQSNLWLISSDSRDPGQHLYHLLKYGIEDVKQVSEIDQMLKFSRHLFLKNPVRLIIESRRSDQKQIEELLKLNIPVYNAKSLGKIWGYFKNDNQASFILDARQPGELSCNSL